MIDVSYILRCIISLKNYYREISVEFLYYNLKNTSWTLACLISNADLISNKTAEMSQYKQWAHSYLFIFLSLIILESYM